MNVLLLSRYESLGASSRVRFFQYLPYLEAHGVRVTVAPMLTDGYLSSFYARRRMPVAEIARSYLRRLVTLFRAGGYDLLWLEKELFPFLPAWGESLLDILGVPCVVDYDDATFHGYDHYAGRLVRTLMGNKIDLVMRRAALVVAGNDYLAERAHRAGARRVAYLPSVVDEDRYGPDASRGGDPFTVGWIGSPTTAPYLKTVETALAEVCGDGKGRLVVIGAGTAALHGFPVETRPWSEDTEVAGINSFDVGIMPLRDDPWERGKCGYKLIQYMACGRPVVASPVGVNRAIVDHGVNGFLASSNEEWVRYLAMLRDDHATRGVMGMAARRTVEAEFSLRVAAPRLLELLRSAIGGCH